MLENEAGPFTVRPPSAVSSPVIVALPVTARFAGLPGVAAPTVSGDVMVPKIATGPFSVVDAGADTVIPPFEVSNPVKVVVPGTVNEVLVNVVNEPAPPEIPPGLSTAPVSVVPPGTTRVPIVPVPGTVRAAGAAPKVIPPLAVSNPVVVVVPVRVLPPGTTSVSNVPVPVDVMPPGLVIKPVIVVVPGTDNDANDVMPIGCAKLGPTVIVVAGLITPVNVAIPAKRLPELIVKPPATLNPSATILKPPAVTLIPTS